MEILRKEYVSMIKITLVCRELLYADAIVDRVNRNRHKRSQSQRKKKIPSKCMRTDSNYVVYLLAKYDLLLPGGGGGYHFHSE